MLSIIDRYILREVSKTFLAIIIVLMLIVVSQSYIQILQDAASGAITTGVLMKLLGMEVLEVLGQVMPAAFFFAILSTLGRMYRDSEMTALAVGGVGTFRVYRAFLLAALPVTALVAWLTLSLLPWANLNKEKIMQSQEEQTAELETAVSGRFNEFSGGDLLFYVESMSEDKSRLHKVFVQNRKHGELGLISANEGYQYVDHKTGGHYLVLTNGHRYEGTPGDNLYTTGDFDTYAILLDKNSSSDKVIPAKALPTSHLFNSSKIHEMSEFELRMMFPVAVIIFTIISIPLSKSLPREGIYGRMVLAILVYVIFLNFQAVSGDWMVKGTTSPWMGRWWVHPFMLLLVGLLLSLRSPALSHKLGRLYRGLRS
ncbi:MAG: LPS export ABC transporter permease LptF [Candidatus Sedimenticola sp. (ex Thyasira tokunagai)]